MTVFASVESSVGIIDLARAIAQRASGEEGEAWRDVLRRFEAMTPGEREAFLGHLEVTPGKHRHADKE